MSCTSTSTARQQTAPRFRHRPRTTVFAAADYTADNDIDQVISQFSSGITVFFPPNPLIGQPITLIAATGGPITADGNGNDVDVTVTPALVPAGSGQTWVFVGNQLGTDLANDASQPGSWIPVS